MTQQLSSIAIRLAESGMVPDRLLKAGISYACGRRLRELKRVHRAAPEYQYQHFLNLLNKSPVAESTDKANEQHYELPPDFFGCVLGPRLKYSCCEWGPGVENLGDAEQAALKTVVLRSELMSGQQILELGCGWGSLSLYLAERFPTANITAVSNSHGQRMYIEHICNIRRITNLQVITADINTFKAERQYDRIVSVEMFEHVRNYSKLFGQIRNWLKDDGKLFVHVFSHSDFPYIFETDGAKNWMGRYFFTGGIMPSHDLLVKAQDSLRLENQWRISGTNYAQTADAWLANLDRNKIAILRVLTTIYGEEESKLWFQRWRMFFIACRELFAYRGGSEWGVSHHLFVK